MRTVNRVTLIGALGRDAETRHTTSGAACTTFSVATSRRWKDQQSNEYKEATDWHNVVLWRSEKLAEYLTKGKQVYVDGRLQTRSYEKDGQKHWATEIVANEVILLGGGEKREAGGSSGSSRHSSNEPEPQWNGANDEDVPF